MSGETDVDPDALQADLDRIKDAMGLRERYPMAFQLWLLYGGLVVLAAFGSQAVATFELTRWGHFLTWAGLMGLGSLVARWRFGTFSGGDATPNLWVQTLAVFGLIVAAFAAMDPVVGDASRTVDEAVTFAVIVSGIGAAYVVHASSLRAYHVRARDRYAFYAGGAWMLAYGPLMANVAFLLEWGYAAFGILFGLHAVASYVVLSQ
ncbi:hypothetical protein [Halovivax gelatinilyticus]|uniref:hypothetical protein n=1 Tax=Halovivax gelatinilyticus TaxID=2961597 RepID=UPI0020CA340C|nr:hypothetical protein [Halovivax gelatinilyticus]